ncbi:MAG: hypothetical protein IJ216_04490 [Acidaminococcaceae bacterium]|nr:hypothetical protein [Acidaminococcaceae bacterium]
MNGKAVRQRKDEKSFLTFKKEKRDSCCGAISFFIKTNASFKDFVYNIFIGSADSKKRWYKQGTAALAACESLMPSGCRLHRVKRADKLICVYLPNYFAKATKN